MWSAELIPTLDALGWLAHLGSATLASGTLGRSKLQWYFRAARHRPPVIDLFRGTIRLRGAHGLAEQAAAAVFLARAVVRVLRGR